MTRGRACATVPLSPRPLEDLEETVRGLPRTMRLLVIQRQGRKPLARLVRSGGDEIGID